MKFNFWINSKEKSYPRDINHYFELNKSGVSEATQYVIFDTESSSLSISSAQLLSIGAVKLKDNNIAINDTFNCFIETGKSGVKGNVHIHEIMSTGKEERKEMKKALLDFLDFIGNSVLVAHHAKHDISLIEKNLSQIFPGVRIVNKVIDTADVAIERDLLKEPSLKISPKNYSLDALLKRYDIEAVERHTALGDAFSTALLFLKMR